MLTNRTIVLSLSLAAVAVLGAGCQSGTAAQPAAAGRAAADNTAEVCDAFRHFEVDHLDKTTAGPPSESAAADNSLGSFDLVAAADMTKLAGRATDPTVSAQLKAIATQISALADKGSVGKTYDEVERAHAEIFAAGGKAWVALEGRCGKAVVPTP